MRFRRGYVISIGAAFVVSAFVVHSCVYVNPKFRSSALLGCTPAQVIARLGPPTYDGRIQPPDNPVILSYEDWSGEMCIIRFENNEAYAVEFKGK